MTDSVNGDVLRVVAGFLANSAQDVMENVYHLEVNGADVAEADILDAVATWLDDAYGAYNGSLSTGLDYDRITVYNLTQGFLVGDTAWPTLTSGAASGDQEPPQTCPFVKFPSDVQGSQGRKYLPNITEANTDSGGQIASGSLATLAGYAAAILADIIPQVGTALIPGNWNPDLVRFAHWTAALVTATLRTQRRRVRGVGS